MTTSQKLWLGFGTLTVLLVVVCVAVLVRVRSIEGAVHEQSNVARPRSSATRELEINVIDYALAVHEYLHGGNPKAKRETDEEAADVEREQAEYERLAMTDRQREMATRFAAMWKEMHAIGQTILNAENRQPKPEDVTRFHDLRTQLEKFLDDEMQADALDTYNARRDATLQDVQTIVGVALILLIVGVVIAVLTSVMVGRAVVKGERAIAEQAERLRTTLASIGDAVITTDMEGRITNLNAVAESLTGWTTSEATYQPLDAVFRIVNEETRQTVENPVQKVLKLGRIVGLANHTALIAKDGTERPIDDSAAPIRCNEGEIVGCVLVFRDVTERRREETALRRHAEQLRDEREWLRVTLGSIGDAVITTDTESRITYLNVVAESVTGWAKQDAVGQPLDTVFRIVNEQTRQAVENPAARALREGVIVGLANHTVLVRKDKRELPIDDSAASIKDAQGHVLGVVLVFRDVTARRRAERSAWLMASIVESSDDAIIGKDVNGIITSWNRAAERLFGYSAAEAIGRPIAILAPPDRADEMPTILARLKGGEYVEHFDTVRRAKDGRLVPISLTMSPIKDEDGEIVGASKIARDISERKRAEAALHEERERLHATLTGIGDAVIVTDAKGRITLMNPVGQTLTGWTQDEAVGKPLDDVFRIVNEQTRKPVENPATKALREGVIVGLANHTVLIRKDGTERPIDDSAAPIRDAQGHVLGCVLVFRDVTENRRQAKEVEASQQTLFNLIERCPFGIYIVDADFRIVNMNAGSQTGAFINVRPIIGRPFDEAMRILWPEQVAADIIKNFRHTLDTGEPYYSKDFVSPRADIKQKEGYEWELHRITLANGRHGVVCYYFDSTRLRQAEERTRSVLQNVIDGIITIDERGMVQSFNPAAERLFGYPASEVIGQNVKMLMPEPYHHEHDGYLSNYLQTGEAKIIGIGREVVGRRKDDSTFPMELAVSEFWVGDIRHFTGIVRDISERKQAEAALNERAADVAVALGKRTEEARRAEKAEQELREADRRKNEFLATLAHELRNPLAPICNAVQILKVKGPPDPDMKWSREVIDRQVQHMARLLDDLLDVSRITHNKLELRKERIELAAVVQSAVETSRPLIDHNGHELIITLAPEPVYLDADPVRLAQVFSNLLNNAAKYTGPGGHIRLTCERQGSDVVVSVKDDGMGIAAEMLPRVFDVFSQAKRVLERSQGGLGIGLSLVRGLVELHGGRVEAHSDGPDNGCEFIVRLPLVVEKVVQKAVPRSEVGAQTSVTKRRLLIVDDLKDSADSLAMLLRMMGHEVHTAYDGEDAIIAADKFRPEVVLLDIGMPKLNGYDACRCIRQQPWGKGMYLVALTGWGQEGDRRRTEEAGFNHHLVKPVDPATLMEVLAELQATAK